MICEDDVSLRRHKRLGLYEQDNCKSSDIGLQISYSSHDRLLASWRHRRLISLDARWRRLMHRFGLMFLFILMLLIVVVLWISRVAYAQPHYQMAHMFRFLSIGDFGSGSKDQIMVAKQMKAFAMEHELKFVAGLGDNFYEQGIKNLKDQKIAILLKNIYTDKVQKRLTSIPWFMALGDHDHRGNVSAQIEYSKKSPFWKMPEPYFVKHIVHGKEGPTLDLIVTDSVGLEGALLEHNEPRRFQHFYKDDSLTGARAGVMQMIWLEDTLKASTADWIVVTGHRPLYSVASRKRFPVELRMHEELMPLFAKYGVDLYLHGHDHVGQHSIRGQYPNAMVHIGNGVGGYGNQHIKSRDKETIWANDDYQGFCTHLVQKDWMVVSFIDQNGNKLHQAMVKSKRAERRAHQAALKKKPEVDLGTVSEVTLETSAEAEARLFFGLV